MKNITPRQLAILTGGMEELEAQFLQWSEENPEQYRALLDKLSQATKDYEGKQLRDLFRVPQTGFLRPSKPENVNTTYTVATAEPQPQPVDIATAIEQARQYMVKLDADRMEALAAAGKKWRESEQYRGIEWRLAPPKIYPDYAPRFSFGLGSWITPPAYLYDFPSIEEIEAEVVALEAEILGIIRTYIVCLIDQRAKKG